MFERIFAQQKRSEITSANSRRREDFRFAKRLAED
jgi:hypothetical protein